jgi:CheY-like chemotaxis protein
MILEQASFTVLLATTADEATQIERDFTGTIDLVLTSVSLPRGSGPELAAQLARNRPGLKAMLGRRSRPSAGPSATDPAERTDRLHHQDREEVPPGRAATFGPAESR